MVEQSRDFFGNHRVVYVYRTLNYTNFLHLTTVSKAKAQLLQCIQGKKTGKGQH